MYIWNNLTLAGMWEESTKDASLETGRPGRILHKSYFQIMLAIQLVRRVKFWYILKIEPTGLADRLDGKMMERKKTRTAS